LKILKYIWNLFFCSPEKKSDTVVDLESKNEYLSPYTNCLVDDILDKDSVILNENNQILEPRKKKRTNVIGLKTKQEIKEYFLEFGSLDTFTCQQKFKVKSLRNFIWALRKDGFAFKKEKIFLDNEKGEKIKVINYKIMSVKQNGKD
jgi:hypothetical protein